MTPDEFQSELRHASEHVIDLTRKSMAPTSELRRLIQKSRNMRANEDAQVYGHLEKAFEEMIARPETVLRDGQSHRKMIPLGSFNLEVTVIHREPELEKLTGVDVLYNAGDIKVLLFQHKKRSTDGELSFSKDDRIQLSNIMRQCDECDKSRISTRGRFIKYHCGSMYVVGDVFSNRRHVVSACELDKYRKEFRRHSNTSASFNPVTIATVDRQFAECQVGRVLDIERLHSLSSELREFSLAAPHVVIDAALHRADGATSLGER